MAGDLHSGGAFAPASGVAHGPIAIGITPDEEVGSGADHFDVRKFGAKTAYTVDGGELGEIEYENFNAANATFFIFTASTSIPAPPKTR